LEALKCDRNNLSCFNNLLVLYLFNASSFSSSFGTEEKLCLYVENSLQKIISLDPQQKYYQSLINHYIINGKYFSNIYEKNVLLSKIENLYSKFLDLDDQNPVSYINLGGFYLTNNDYYYYKNSKFNLFEKTEGLFLNAFKLSKEQDCKYCCYAKLALAILYNQYMGRPQEALKLYKEALNELEINPETFTPITKVEILEDIQEITSKSRAV